MAHLVWKDSNNNTLIQGVGESHRLVEWKRILPKSLDGKEYRERLDVQLVAEPTNAVDKTAVMMFAKGQHVGYLPRNVAAVLFDHVMSATKNEDTVAVPGSIWAVKRSDGLKANVSVFMPDDLLEGIDFDYSSEPVYTTAAPSTPKKSPASVLAIWGLILAGITLLGSGAGFGTILVGIASLVVNYVWYSKSATSKIVPLVALGATGLGLLLGIIFGIIKAAS